MMAVKLFKIIKQAFISAVNSDGTAYPTAQATYNEKATDVVRLSSYGLCSNPPTGSLALLLSSNGQEAVKYAVIDDMQNRFKNLAEGEVVLFNYETGNYVYLKNDGEILINTDGDIKAVAGGNIEATAGGSIEATASSSATVTAPTITLAGNVVIQGSLTQTGGSASSFSGSTTMPSASIGGLNFGSHKHTGVDAGTDTSGGPTA